MIGVSYSDADIPNESIHILNTGYTKMGGSMYYFPEGNKRGKNIFGQYVLSKERKWV